MRIAIINAKFDPRLGYLEVIFAKELKRMGHDVRVFTAGSGLTKDGVNLTDFDKVAAYPIDRAKRYWKIGTTVFPLDATIGKRITEFQPELAFLPAPGHGPGYFWIKHLPKTCKIVPCFSDLYIHKKSPWRWKLKQCWYRKILERADLVVAVTEETKRLLEEISPLKRRAPILMTGLPIDSEVYRGVVRSNPPDAVKQLMGRVKRMVAGATRIYPGKGCEKIIQSILAVMRRYPDVGLVYAGFGNDDYSQQLKNELEQHELADRCCFLPIIPTEAINGIFSLAHCSVWSQVSVGIQQSLACGCPALLREGQPATHILENGVSGQFYAGFESLESAIAEVLATNWPRDRVRGKVLPYLGDAMLENIFSKIGIR